MFGSRSQGSGSGSGLKGFQRHAGRGPSAARPSYNVQVVKKLKSLNDFQGLSEADLHSRAEELTDPVKLWSVYFSGVVLDPAREHIERNLQGEIATPPSEVAAEKAHMIPVKLRIEPVRGGRQYAVESFTSLLLEHYGALHASLLIGDSVFLEWSTAGLVIPTGKPIPPEPQQPSVNTSPHATNSSATPLEPQQPSADARSANSAAVEAVILQEFETASSKKGHMDKLIEVVARYNKNYFYHPIFRNCQKFVAELLSCLGYPVHPRLEGHLGGYYKEVREGVKHSLAFDCHADLDTYVEKALETRGVAVPEAEYLMGQYFIFHVTGMTESATVERWHCPVQGCRMAQLEATFELRETIAYRRLQAHQ